jgi:hypothetical protein
MLKLNSSSLKRFDNRKVSRIVFFQLSLLALSALLTSCEIPHLPLIAITGPQDQPISLKEAPATTNETSIPTRAPTEALPPLTPVPTEIIPTPEPTHIPVPIMGVQVGYQNSQILNLLAQAKNF